MVDNRNWIRPALAVAGALFWAAAIYLGRFAMSLPIDPMAPSDTQGLTVRVDSYLMHQQTLFIMIALGAAVIGTMLMVAAIFSRSR